MAPASRPPQAWLGLQGCLAACRPCGILHSPQASEPGDGHLRQLCLACPAGCQACQACPAACRAASRQSACREWAPCQEWTSMQCMAVTQLLSTTMVPVGTGPILGAARTQAILQALGQGLLLTLLHLSLHPLTWHQLRQRLRLLRWLLSQPLRKQEQLQPHKAARQRLLLMQPLSQTLQRLSRRRVSRLLQQLLRARPSTARQRQLRGAHPISGVLLRAMPMMRRARSRRCKCGSLRAMPAELGALAPPRLLVRSSRLAKALQCVWRCLFLRSWMVHLACAKSARPRRGWYVQWWCIQTRYVRAPGHS
mmetsp:Transcript_85305/g.155437  ORF Transcript_85305/g.155437 Transcript_85305/m.155437 type:complete len:309 (-) Transcript_85305:273-1199(-)